MGSVARTYDGVGNTTAIGGAAKQFNYAEDDRMSSVQQGGAIVRSYAYNALGERVLSTIPAVTGNPDGSGGTPAVNTYTVYDESGRWLGDYDHNGAVLQQAIWLDDLPVGLLAGSGANQTLHYIEPDHLGTPRAVIDRSRDVAIWTWALQGEAFGNSPPNQDPDLDSTNFVLDMRFPGQRYDAATGLNYNYFRDYDASTGRYSEPDSIGLAGGISLYGYAGGNSLARIDPFGLRDVIVAIWLDRPRSGQVGHVLMAEVNGKVLTSQFPDPHGTHGKNVVYDWPRVLKEEGRRPDGIFRMSVPNDEAFDAAVRDVRARPSWDWMPGEGETNCVDGANEALRAGGRPVVLLRALLPRDMYNALRWQDYKYNTVTELDSAPWEKGR